MTANEVLIKHLESAYSDTLNPTEEEFVLKAMDEWAKYYNSQMIIHVGTLEFDKGQGTYLSCNGDKFNELYMLKTEEVTIFAVAPQHSGWNVGDVFYTATGMSLITFLQRYITEIRVFGRPDASGKAPVQKSLGARVRLVGMNDWFTFSEELPKIDFLIAK